MSFSSTVHSERLHETSIWSMSPAKTFPALLTKHQNTSCNCIPAPLTIHLPHRVISVKPSSPKNERTASLLPSSHLPHRPPWPNTTPNNNNPTTLQTSNSTPPATASPSPVTPPLPKHNMDTVSPRQATKPTPAFLAAWAAAAAVRATGPHHLARDQEE